MIPEGWNSSKLGEICEDISYGYTESASLDEVGPKFLRITDIQDYFINWGNVPYCPITDIDHKKYKLYKGDIVIARTGASTGVTAIFKEENIEAVYASYLIRYKINRELADPFFIGYVLKSPFWANHVNSIIGGSAQPGANAKQFASFKLHLPPLAEQSNIASILSSLDDKIELNLQMNKTLEALAQAIFKEWFIDFRFPGFDGELVNGLPKGWNRKSFKDVLALLKDGSHNPPQRVNGGIRFIAGATDIKDLVVQFDKCTYISKVDYEKIHKNWELKVNDLLITIVGTIGNTAIVRESDLPFSLQRSIAVIRPKPDISHLYIYLILKSKDFSNYLRSRTNPTGQPGIYLGTLSEYETIVPSREVMHRFHEIQSSLFEKMQRNITENQTLVGIRDSLLPKLMTGKIKVA